MRLFRFISVLAVLAGPATARAQAHDTHAHDAHARPADDSAFRAMQSRGQAVMGVDQYTSIHRFDALRDGGRIELQRDRDDSAGVATIRTHLRTIAHAFGDGDFSAPAAVHLERVPGVTVMRSHRAAIRYEVVDLPRGAALRVRTSDTAAVAAIHRFLAYQRREHRAGGVASPAP